MKRSNVDRKDIRSLSAPVQVVRQTKTSFLRHKYSNNTDLQFLLKPTMSETNPTIIGQNKSVAKTTERKVNSWFRERSYHEERLNRLEDEAFQKLCILEKKKLELLERRSREASLERSATVVDLDVPHEDEVTARPEDPHDVTAEVTPAGGKSHAAEGPTQATKPSPKENVKFSENPASKFNIEFDNSSKLSGSVQNSPRKPDENKADGTKSAREQNARFDSILEASVRVKSDNNDQKPVRVSYLAPRPVTQGALADKTRHGDEGAARPVTNIGKAPAPMPATPAIPNREYSSRLAALEGAESKLLAMSSSDKFVYWKRDKAGQLKPSDVPFRRREFEVPPDRDDQARIRKLVNMEKKSVRASLQKYTSLSEDIANLEKWNPLEEVLEKERQAKLLLEKEGFDAKDGWKKLGMLQHWVRAFGIGLDQDILDMDPNSPEALKRCRYLRLKPRSQDASLLPDEEKAKSSWANSGNAHAAVL